MFENIYILGAGGHAKVLISTLLANGHRVAAVYDDDTSLAGTEILGVPVAGTIKDLPQDFAEPAAIGIGDNRIRKSIADRFAQCPWVVAVHPKAHIAPTAQLGPGSVVFAGAVVQSEARLGRHVIVNTGATVDHDCEVGDFSHIAPGAHIAGQVRLGTGALAGIGCSIIQNLLIGDWTKIGAGAAVIDNLPANVTAVGIPARIVKEN